MLSPRLVTSTISIAKFAMLVGSQSSMTSDTCSGTKGISCKEHDLEENPKKEQHNSSGQKGNSS